jgi:sugar phosphate isomerase/epimerase
MGFDGLELSFKSVVNLEKAATDTAYCDEIRAVLKDHHLGSWAISSHAIGQCVGDLYDKRLNIFIPERLHGKPDDIRKWAIESMMMVPVAAKNLSCSIVTTFTGSPIWKYFYSFPTTPQAMVEEGFDEIAALWTPILDEFKKHGIAFAFEVHPSEIAFDYYTTQRLIDKLGHHEAFGINFDPSHLLWQGVDPALFIRDFAPYIRHVHMKDVAVRKDGRCGILGSHLPFGDSRRAWNFRSVGRGDVDFEEIIRALNDISYTGPLSVEWEDNGMDRFHGAKESLEYIRKLEFPTSQIKWL